VGTPGRRRPVGRPRCGWEDDRMDVKEIRLGGRGLDLCESESV
jgi:hypothetical protein